MTRLTRTMSRRDFMVGAAAAAAGGATLNQGVQGRPAPGGHGDAFCDVLVYGATPAGIAAAVAAARLGRCVILAALEDHIGGILSNGLTNADIGKKQAVGGLFYEFTRRVVRHYQQQDQANGRADQPNVKLCQNGYFFEAGVAEQIFHEMLTEQAGRIELRLEHELTDAVVAGSELVQAVFANRRASDPADKFALIGAGAFIDATYEGDLAAMAKAPYRIGRESRDEYHEPHAGRIYTHFGTTEPLPGSTGEADNATQANCFRFHVTTDPEKRLPIEKPKDYRREDYRYTLENLRGGLVHSFQQVIQVYPMPNGRFELNSNHCDPKTGVPAQSFDLAEENFAWAEATPAERRKIYARYLSHNVGLLWLMQNDPDVPPAIQAEAKKYGWHRDEWPSNGHMPRQVYVREGRRILGEYVLTEHDGDVDPKLDRTAIQPTSVAIIEYAFDSHGCHAYDPAHPGVREGYVFIKHEPLQVPYAVLVPKKINGLLVPVACSASHVAYCALRMEPVFMALGQACGTAAHLALQHQTALRDVPSAELQKLLVSRGAVITFYADLQFTDPDFPAFQWLGARGLNAGYKATPDLKLTRSDGWTRLDRILRTAGKPALETLAGDPQAPLAYDDLVRWLKQSGAASTTAPADAPAGQPLTLRQFAATVYRALSS